MNENREIGSNYLDHRLVRTINIKHPCVVCSKSCTKVQEAICCNICDEWTHKKCACLTEEEFEVYCSTDKPFYCVKCLYEKNDPNTLNSVLTNSSCDLLSNLPYNPSLNDSIINAPSSFWLSDAYESETKYFDFDQINVLLNGMDNKEFSIIHVNAVSLVKRYDSVHAMLARLA